MIRSMTGYGRAEHSTDEMDVAVELKSVNHRYLEFSARVPRNYAFLEERLKRYFQQRVSRGKLDVFVSIDASRQPGVAVAVSYTHLDVYKRQAHKILPGRLPVYDLHPVLHIAGAQIVVSVSYTHLIRRPVSRAKGSGPFCMM